MKPGGHVVGPPARAPLGGRVDAAEARRLGDQLQRGEEPLRRSALASVNPTSGPPSRIWRAATACCGMVLQPGVADAEHVRALAQQPREGERVRALTLEPQRERRRASGAAARPRTARRSSRPASGARAARPPTPGRACATAPSTRSEWPESAFVALYITTSAPSSSGRWPSGVESVLSTASRAPAACAASATAAMSQTSSAGFAGVSTHTSVAPVAGGDDRLGVGRHEPHLDAARREPVGRDAADARVAVADRDEHVAGAERRLEHRAQRGHPGGEQHALGALERAERGLDGGPRRVAVAPVAVRRGVLLALQVERRREHRAGRERLALLGAPAARRGRRASRVRMRLARDVPRLGLAQAARQQLQQRDRGARVVHQEAAERAQRHDQAAHLLERGHRRGARLAVDARQVAEQLARAALGQHDLVAAGAARRDPDAAGRTSSTQSAVPPCSKMTVPGA